MENIPLSPYADRAAEYQREAIDSLSRLAIPPSLQALVRSYFTVLEP